MFVLLLGFAILVFPLSFSPFPCLWFAASLPDGGTGFSSIAPFLQLLFPPSLVASVFPSLLPYPASFPFHRLPLTQTHTYAPSMPRSDALLATALGCFPGLSLGQQHLQRKRCLTPSLPPSVARPSPVTSVLPSLLPSLLSQFPPPLPPCHSNTYMCFLHALFRWSLTLVVTRCPAPLRSLQKQQVLPG